MRMTQSRALAMSATMAVAFLAACSDSPTAPTKASAVTAPNLNVGDSYTPTPAVVQGRIVVCKAGNVGGSFDVTGSLVGGAHTANFAGLDFPIATGTCLSVAEDFSTDVAVGANVTITEDAAANTVSTITGCRFKAEGSAEQNCADFNANPRFINSYHGYVITYTNTFTPPPPPPSGCTFTKGWYRNNGSDTITGVDGLSINVETAIFAATPGKPGPVTWNGGNDVLNLYQQLLAALENGGANGPAAVKTAIAAAQAGTSVSGFAITSTLSQADVSALIDTLSAFNEGTFPNWPHCS